MAKKSDWRENASTLKEPQTCVAAGRTQGKNSCLVNNQEMRTHPKHFILGEHASGGIKGEKRVMVMWLGIHHLANREAKPRVGRKSFCKSYSV